MKADLKRLVEALTADGMEVTVMDLTTKGEVKTFTVKPPVEAGMVYMPVYKTPAGDEIIPAYREFLNCRSPIELYNVVLRFIPDAVDRYRLTLLRIETVQADDKGQAHIPNYRGLYGALEVLVIGGPQFDEHEPFADEPEAPANEPE